MQGDLWGKPPEPPARKKIRKAAKLRRTKSIAKSFVEFHEQNPQVYQELVRLARHAMTRGRKKIGIKMLWEVMRWNVTVETECPTGFKLCNNYHSRYARLIAEQESDLADCFEMRGLRS